MTLVREARLQRRFNGGAPLFQQFFCSDDTDILQITVWRDAFGFGKRPEQRRFAQAGAAANLL